MESPACAMTVLEEVGNGWSIDIALLKKLSSFERQHFAPVVPYPPPPGLCDVMPLSSLSGPPSSCRSMQHETLFQDEPVHEPFEGDVGCLGSKLPLSSVKGSGITPSVQQPQEEGQWDCTTVMLRNLPDQYTRAMLMDTISVAGFRDTFDFFHVPMDSGTNMSKGHAFINFRDSETAWRFKVAFDGKPMGDFNSIKFVVVTKAVLQGFEANYAHHHNAHSSRGDISMRPMFLNNPAMARKPAEFCGTPGSGTRRHRIPYVASAPALKPQQVSQARRSAGKPQHAHLQDPAPHDRNTTGFCPFCGAGVQVRYRFCQHCGTSLQGVF